MAYMEQLESSLSGLVSAGEAGRKGVDGMLSPLNGAIGSITGAASELENIPFVGGEAGAKLGRIVRSINVAQSQVGQVASMYSRAVTGAAQVQERLGTFKTMAAKVTAEAGRVAGLVSPSLSNVLPTGGLLGSATPLPQAVAPFPHLLIIQPHDPKKQPYYFNLDTAAFDELRRQATYRWAGQERLRRSVAQQAVGLGRPAPGPGLGAFVIDAISGQDFAIVRTMVFLGAALYIASNVLIDIAYTWVDPRVRLS